MRVLWPALPDFGNQSLLFLGSGAALWPFPPCGGWTVVGCCWPWPANGMGSICAGMRGWWRSILSRFRSGCFWGFPCLFRHGLLPLSPESSFCLALGRCEGTGSIGQNFSGCLLRQTGGTFVGSLLITGGAGASAAAEAPHGEGVALRMLWQFPFAGVRSSWFLPCRFHLAAEYQVLSTPPKWKPVPSWDK